METTEIPHSIRDQNLEKKVVDILNEISVNVSPNNIEAWHHVYVSKIAQKK